MNRSLLTPVLAALILAGAIGRPPPASGGEVHTVTIEAMKFMPADLQVAPADTVVWVNKDLFPHTATSEAPGFDSGEIAAEKSWSWVATGPGEYPYLCSYHPTMRANIRVKPRGP